MSRSVASNSDVMIFMMVLRETSIPVLPRITVTALTMILILAMMGSLIVWIGQTRIAPYHQRAPVMILTSISFRLVMTVLTPE